MANCWSDTDDAVEGVPRSVTNGPGHGCGAADNRAKTGHLGRMEKGQGEVIGDVQIGKAGKSEAGGQTVGDRVARKDLDRQGEAGVPVDRINSLAVG